MSGSDLDRLASYLLKEWGDHPAWAIDETCPQGKGAVDLAIEILQQCKAERESPLVAVSPSGAALTPDFAKQFERGVAGAYAGSVSLKALSPEPTGDVTSQSVGDEIRRMLEDESIIRLRSNESDIAVIAGPNPENRGVIKMADNERPSDIVINDPNDPNRRR